MITGQKLNIIQFPTGTTATSDLSSHRTRKDPTGEEYPEEAFTSTDRERINKLIEMVKQMPENIAKTLMEAIFITSPNQVVTEREILTVNIEKEPAVDKPKHKKNINRLMELKKIHPQTGNDIFVSEE